MVQPTDNPDDNLRWCARGNHWAERADMMTASVSKALPDGLRTYCRACHLKTKREHARRNYARLYTRQRQDEERVKNRRLRQNEGYARRKEKERATLPRSIPSRLGFAVEIYGKNHARVLLSDGTVVVATAMIADRPRRRKAKRIGNWFKRVRGVGEADFVWLCHLCIRRPNGTFYFLRVARFAYDIADHAEECDLLLARHWFWQRQQEFGQSGESGDGERVGYRMLEARLFGAPNPAERLALAEARQSERENDGKTNNKTKLRYRRED